MPTVPDFVQANVVVIGDLMLDSYWQGDTQRISPEAPVPVVNVAGIDKRPGGAANVAFNLQALDANVTVIGLCGQDAPGDELIACLDSAGINAKLIQDASIKTITKLRVLSQSQQLLRLDFEEPFEQFDKTSMVEAFESILGEADIVVLSDYGKGTLSDTPQLITLCQKYNVPVLIDPKGTDYSKYQFASMLTPNKKEFELVMGAAPTVEVLIEKGQQMLKDFELESLLVTRGAEGMTLFRHDKAPFHLKANAKSVYDVTGAGDTVIGVLSACLASGLDIETSLQLANFAAGKVVGEVGAATVSRQDLLAFYHDNELISFDQLQTILSQHRADDEAYRLVRLSDMEISVDQWHQMLLSYEKGEKLYLIVDGDSTNPALEKLIKLVANVPFVEGVAALSNEQSSALS